MTDDVIDPIHKLRLYSEGRAEPPTKEEAAEIVKEYDSLDIAYIKVANELWEEMKG